MANYTYTASTIATMPAVTSLADGTLVFVESNRSWYRSDLAGNVYRRESFADPTWAAQAAWGIDTVGGNDENVGSVASPLKTFAELRARLPILTLGSYTIGIAAGSAFGAGDPMQWQPIIATGSTAPLITFTGAATASAPKVVVTATNEAGNVPPQLDAGFAFTIGDIVQVTSGAQIGNTAIVSELVAGTNFNISRWRTPGGVASNAPAGGDTVAVATLPTVARFSFASPSAIPIIQSLDIAAFDAPVTVNEVFQVCKLGGSISLTKALLVQFDGCYLNNNNFLGTSCAGARIFFSLCGLVRTGAAQPYVQATFGGQIQFTNCLIVAGGIDASEGGVINCNHLGIRSSGLDAVYSHDGGLVTVTNTLYGANNAVKGTVVKDGGRVSVLVGFTPTLAAAGQELELEGAAVANPIVAGLPVAAAALINWAQWAAAPFGRNVMSYQSGAIVINRAT